MKKLLLFTLFLPAFVYCQTTWKNALKPANSNVALEELNNKTLNVNAPKAINCIDTLRYPQIKEQIVGNSTFYLLELWTVDNEAASQAFLLSGATHQITGVELFGRNKPGGPTSVSVRASIFAVDANNNPTGPELGFGTLTISDTNFTYRQINLAQPVTVSSNYAVVIRPTSANGILEVYVNNAAPGQTYDENLSRITSTYYSASSGNWVSVPVLTSSFTGGPYDFEVLVAPRVSYPISTNFTTTPSLLCVGSPVTFNNATTPASLISNRMYNFTALQMHFLNEPDSLYATDPGVAPTTLLWGTTVNYTYTAANTYNATRYTLGGLWASCLDFRTNVLTVNAPPAQPLGISGPNPICANTSANYGINPVPGATSYTWNLPSGWTGTSTTNVIPVTVGTNSGTISVTANNTCGSSTPATLNVTVNQDNATFTYPTNTICASAPNQTPTVATPGGNFTATPAGLVFANPSTGEIDVAASALGTYTITYTTPGPCVNTGSQTITITNAPDASFTYANTSYCLDAANPSPILGPGASIGTFSATPSGLSISPTTGVINLSASSAGTYTVTNTIPASGSCPAASATFNITLNALPTATVSGGGSACAGNNVNVTITFTGSSPWMFSFSDGNNSNNVMGQTTNTYTISANSNGVYSVLFVSDANCIGTSSGTATVTINPLPTVSVSPSSATICSGNNVSLTASGANTYTWSPATGLSSTSGATVTATPTSTTTYTVTGVDANNCSNTANVTVTVNNNPNVTFTISNNNACVNWPATTLTGGSPAGGTYSGPGVSGGQFNPSVAGVGTHTITYTYTDGNGCSGSATQTITVNACTGMEESSIARSLLIAPNPVKEQLMISFNNANSNKVQVNIISADGKLVYSENASAASQYVRYLDVTTFAKGLYFIQIVSNEGMINNKIIVQ